VETPSSLKENSVKPLLKGAQRGRRIQIGGVWGEWDLRVIFTGGGSGKSPGEGSFGLVHGDWVKTHNLVIFWEDGEGDISYSQKKTN